MQNRTLSKMMAVCLAAVSLLYLPTASATDASNGDSPKAPGQHKFAFGFQLAPLTAGISVKYQPGENWAFQLAITPDSSDNYVTLRGLRTLQRSNFWSSYYFAGVTHRKYTDEIYQNNTNSFVSLENNETLVSTGLGIEWGWQAKNVNRPPLFTSMELGLGHKTQQYEGGSSDNNIQLVLGLALHYHF